MIQPIQKHLQYIKYEKQNPDMFNIVYTFFNETI
jgi:hypothetical protein